MQTALGAAAVGGCGCRRPWRTRLAAVKPWLHSVVKLCSAFGGAVCTTRQDTSTAQLIEDAILLANYSGRYEAARILMGHGVGFRDVARLLAGDQRRRPKAVDQLPFDGRTSRRDPATAQTVERVIETARYRGRYRAACFLLCYGIGFRDVARLLAANERRRSKFQ